MQAAPPAAAGDAPLTAPGRPRPASRAQRLRQAGLGLLAAAALLGLGGCSSVGYVAQSVQGHLELLSRARPIDDWLADPATPAALRERLALAREMRRFAVTDLGLPDNASYHRYADLGRGAVVWNVVAAPELSLKPRTWCYPMLGCVGYRGYFDRAEADRMAETLKAEGWEVLVYGVPAYSTLGWTNWLGGDPLLNTFVLGTEGDLARLIFHELAHQVLYVSDDTTFNESFATAVERLGLARWRERYPGPPDEAADQQRRQDFRRLVRATRDALAALYDSPAPEAEKRRRKAELMGRLRAEVAALKAGPWAGYSGYDRWLERANNAAFALQSTYDALVPGFERLHAEQGGDFPRFYAAVRALADLPREQRHARLAGPDTATSTATSTNTSTATAAPPPSAASAPARDKLP